MGPRLREIAGNPAAARNVDGRVVMVSLRPLVALLPLAVGCGSPATEADGNPEPPRCGTPLTDAQRSVDEPDRERPPSRLTHQDPALGACMERATDADALGVLDPAHASERRQPFNADLSRVLLRTGHVLDAESFRVLARAPSETDDGTVHGWRWSDGDPTELFGTRGNELVRFDIDSGEISLAARFDEYVALDHEASAGDPAGGALALVGVRPSDGAREIFRFELNGKRKSAPLVAPLDTVNRPQRPAWTALSPSARWLLIAWHDGGDERFRGVEAFDENLRYAGHVSSGRGSGDVARAADGSEWYVDFSIEAHSSQSGPDVRKYRLPNGFDAARAGDADAVVGLLSVDWFHDLRVSCRADRSDWCVLSTNGDNASGWQPFEDEVFRLHLDSTVEAPVVERLAHHRSAPAFIGSHSVEQCPLSPDAAEPRAVASRNGATVLFASNWERHCTAELYAIHLHGSLDTSAENDSASNTPGAER